MMPVVLCPPGEENIIKRVGGTPEVKKHLENLGFVPGSSITVVSETCGNLILKVRETRVALGKDLAKKIMV